MGRHIQRDIEKKVVSHDNAQSHEPVNHFRPPHERIETFTASTTTCLWINRYNPDPTPQLHLSRRPGASDPGTRSDRVFDYCSSPFPNTKVTNTTKAHHITAVYTSYYTARSNPGVD